MFDTLEMGAGGLIAQRARMNVVANNVLNINTTHNEKGEKIPYRRRFVVLEATRGADNRLPGVHVKEIGQDPGSFEKRYEPGHPDADAQGNVLYPNVNLATEMVDMMEASRAYEATITMMETSKAMFNASLRLIA